MKPTKKQREVWAKAAERGCVICGDSQAQIHHAFTGAGGRKDHDKFLVLCHLHHQGVLGIHHLGRKRWQAMFGSEQELMDKQNITDG